MRRLLLATALVPLLGTPVMAQAPSLTPFVSGPGNPMSEPIEISSLTIFERQMMQDALIWASDYVGLKDGAWGRMTDNALRNWQRRTGANPAVLTNSDIGTLLYMADRAKQAVGWTEWQDPATGAFVGYPNALTKPQRATDGIGMDYLGDQGFRMVTRRLNRVPLSEIQAGLASVAAKPDQTVGYRLDRPDRQVLTTQGNGWTHYLRFDRVGADWVGFMVFAQQGNDRVAKLITAVSTEFSPTGTSNIVEPNIMAAEMGFRAWLGMTDKSPRDALTGRHLADATPSRPAAPTPAPVPSRERDVSRSAAVTAPPANPSPATRVSGSGTAFVVRQDGTLLTNEHVVKGCSRLALPTGEAVQVLASNAKRDLALLRSEKTYASALRFRRDQTIDHGETVRAFGYPYYQMVSTSLNITEGIVTALTGLNDDPSRFQVNAAIQPGNSGGPLVDEDGLVIGVAVSTLSTGRFTEVTGANAQSMNYGIRGQIVEAFLLENGVLVEKARAESRPDLRQIARSVTPFVTPILCYGR
jgi:S1-C subfamily serine protease